VALDAGNTENRMVCRLAGIIFRSYKMSRLLSLFSVCVGDVHVGFAATRACLKTSENTGLQIEGVLAYFTHLICQKYIGDDVGDVRYVFTKK
jgi:hypothetical protein